MDFFDNKCSEPLRKDPVFGLCDNQNGTCAYTNVDEPDKWIATIKNKNEIGVTFTAIDKCVIKDNEEFGRGRCDGMLTTTQHLFLVELKDQAKSWITDSITQLESTIQFLIEKHDLSAFQHKKAFACNKQHKRFKVLEQELNVRFRKEYGFRVDVQAEIIIV
jgi:hypothetical protein